MDVAQFTSKERKQARKSLLKKIDTYNKQARKPTSQQSPGFPITNPSKDLTYKGIVKVTYDRGYALQTKSLLLGNTSTAFEAVEQLFGALGLRGNPKDYALEERNVMTGENRIVDGMELPLGLQLNYGGGQQSYMELRIVQLRDTLSALPISSIAHAGSKGRRGSNASAHDSDSDDTHSDSNLSPKEEVIDHGIAQVEITMEEALQDIPPLVHDIQERLKGISESVAVDGKPRSGLPNRRLLWDRLKPQAAALVKDIRRLVDSGEFLANRHCKSSPVVKLIITLLLEFITDHSRELVTVTKEMCGLRGAAKTDFDSSVSRFTQQVTYISKLVGKTNDSINSMAITAHLLLATSPEKFQSGKLTAESYFTGSKSVSGVLLFVVVSAYLGLVRAAYEEKCEFYASLATNMLRSSQRALETIQKTDEYSKLHLHPLRSRVMDMDHKLRVAMDNLIRKVRVAASSRPPPDATPEMLYCGYSLIMSTLDFLMVAQCASLVHRVAIAGWELMQFPWVRAISENGGSDAETGPVRTAFADQLSSLGSDSTSSHSTGAESSIYRSPPEKTAGERRSRIISQRRESGDGMDAMEMASSEHKVLKVSHLMSQYEQYQDSEEETEDEQNGSRSSLTIGDRRSGGQEVSDATSTRSMAVSSSDTQVSTKESAAFSPSAEQENPHSVGIDAVKKLRRNYNINKVIAKGAESLLLTLTQKVHLLSVLCRDKTKEKYLDTVEHIISASKQVREEVSSMEVDILIGQNMAEFLEKSRSQLERSIKELQLAVSMASGSSDSESATSNLLSAASHLKDMSSKMVAEALGKVTEHKRALEQAERIEKEFISLMTGQRQSEDDKDISRKNSSSYDNKKLSSAIRNAMAGQSDSDGILFEDAKLKPLVGIGRSWIAKETPRVVAATVSMLVQRLTFHRVIDSEFNEIFLLTFYSFMSPEQLLNSLEERFNVQPTEELTESEMEIYTIDVIIPIQLRVIHSLRKWLQLSYDDFKNEALCQKLNSFIAIIQRSMPSCGKQLQTLKEANLSAGPVHLQTKPQGITPTPLVPISLSTGVDFDLLDVNTLELARQLTITYSKLLRNIRPQEVLDLGWVEESRHHLASHIIQILQMSKNLSKLVCTEVMREIIDEDQASVLSYFIQAAKSCLELKNYEAVFAIVGGLGSKEIQRASNSWQMVTDHLKSVYAEMKDLASPELNYHRYKQEIVSLHQIACVPKLDFILAELEAIDKEHPNFHPEKKELVNFQRRRKFTKAIQHIQRYQSIPYNLRDIQVMQQYLGNLKKSLSNEQLEKLSTKIESFSI